MGTLLFLAGVDSASMGMGALVKLTGALALIISSLRLR